MRKLIELLSTRGAVEEASVVHIEFELKRSKRKTLSLQVYPDSSVVVRAPNRSSVRSVNLFVSSKLDWIEMQKKKFASIPQEKPKEYVSGTKFKYLGQTYELHVEHSIVNKVEFFDGKILLQTTTKNKAKIKVALQSWYKQQAEEVFNSRLPECLEKVRVVDIEFEGKLRLRTMRARWGSCSSNGEITLNTRLVEHDIECIDYVIIHELCHLREMNHSRAFYNLMTEAMPNWKAIRKTLR